MNASTSTAPVPTRGFDFVIIQTTDMLRSRAFFEALLGIAPRLTYQDFYVEYDLPDGNTFAIGRDPNAEFMPTGGIVFGVDDADAARARVEALGGSYVKQYGGKFCTAAWCRDPDGNAFGLHQRLNQ